MIKDITKSVLEILKTYPKLESFLYFNSNDFEQCKVSLHSTTSPIYETRYLRDNGIKYNSYEVIVVKPYDIGTSELNYNEFVSVVDFMIWINTLNNIEILRRFNKNIISIECEQNEPRLMNIDESGTNVKYTFPIKVRYSNIKEI